MPASEYSSFMSTEAIRSLHAKLSSTDWITNAYSCIDFCTAFWYNFAVDEIFNDQEKAKRAQKPIEHAARFFLFSQMFEDQIEREYIQKLSNMAIVLQAKHNRAIPLHSAIVLVAEDGKRYILEKDGHDPVSLHTFNEWNTYKDKFGTYAAHGFGITNWIFGNSV